MKKLLVLATSIVLMVTSFSLWSMEVGDQAKSFTFDTIKSGGFVEKMDLLTRQGEQRYTIVEFMAITCGPCVQNLPNMQTLYRTLSAKAQVVMVSIDRNRQQVLAFYDRYKSNIGYPFALDLNREAMRAYNIRATPTIYVIDEKGVIVYKHLGTLSAAEISAIENLVQ